VAARIGIGEIELAYEDSGGDGPAAVLIPGLGGSMYGWRAQSLALAAAGYRAVAYDQRGAGLSSKPPGPYSTELWAGDLVGLLERLGIERVVLVGHSMGCMVAVEAAGRLGERCAAVALCGGRAQWPEATVETFEQRAKLAREGRLDEVAEAVAANGLSERCRAEQPVLWGLLVASIAANDPNGYAESALGARYGSMRSLGDLVCPLLVFAGTEDLATPPAEGEKLAAAAKRGESATIDGAAHWCMLERPAEVSRLLVDFLGRTVPAPS
jgi:pimeloyl-ACP methyl ester carboxylesterase